MIDFRDCAAICWAKVSVICLFFSIVSPLGTQLSILQHCSDKCLDVVMEIWQFETISQAEQREGGELQRPSSFAAGAKVAGAFKGDKYHT